MKDRFKLYVIFLLAVVFSSAPGFAADTDSTTKTATTTTQYSIKTQQADPSAIAKLGDPVKSLKDQIVYQQPVTAASAAPVRNCADYEYLGENTRPVRGGNGPTGYRCPPGYDSHMNGPLCECRYHTALNQAATIPATSSYCSYQICTPDAP